MTYNEINREGFETEVGRALTDEEWNEVIRQVEKFIENAEPRQHEVDDYVIELSLEFSPQLECPENK